MNLNEKAQVLILPTNEKAILYIDNKGIYSKNRVDNSILRHNLYFLSDEQIKDSDWFINGNIDSSNYKIDRATKENLDVINNIAKLMSEEKFPKNVITKKIIASNDKSLYFQCDCCNGTGIIDYSYCITCNGGKLGNLPEAPPKFIKEYVEEWNKGNIITHVLVDYVIMNKGYNSPEDYPYHECEILKVDENNYITITKIKNNFTLEDMKKAFEAGKKFIATENKIYPQSSDFDKWIEENFINI